MRPELTDVQVQAGARPGESWDAARRRLTEQRDRLVTWPRQVFHCACWEPRWSQFGLGWVVEDPRLGIRHDCDDCHDRNATYEEPVDLHPGADYTLSGPIDECEGLDGQPIQWENGELGLRWHE